MSGPLRVYWWRWRHPHALNAGDELTAPLVERLTGRRVVWADVEDCEFVGAGSVLGKVLRARPDGMPVVWGSGFISPPAPGEPLWDVPVAAVRGRASLARLAPHRRAGVAVGDPGLLAPLLLDGPVRKAYALGVVPHYKDAAAPVVERLAGLGRHVRRIEVEWAPEDFAHEIASCDAIVSSSMHGLVFADALGVPNLHLEVGDALVGGRYKFADYLSVFPGRRDAPATAADVAGLDLGAVVRLVHDRFVPPRGLDRLRRGLRTALRSRVDASTR